MSTHSLKSSAAASALLLLVHVEGAITQDGLWTGNDWYDDQAQIGVENGMPYSDIKEVTQRIEAPLTVDGSIDQNYLDR